MVTQVGARNGTWNWSFGTTDGPDDSQSVTITATDSDGEATSTTFALTVDNVAPTVAADNAAVTVNEAATASNAGANSADQGLFRVWSLGQIFSNLTGSSASGLPLTAEARSKRDTFDPLTDDPGLDCIKPGMPRTMTGPHPFQFIDGGDEITVLIGEFDIRRTIHLGEKQDPATITPHKQGYSHGVWKSDVLEVHTSHVDWPFFDGVGTPLGPNAQMDEQFSFSEDGLRLNYEIVITDSSTFTEPVTINKSWVDLGEPMETYDCVAAM